MTKTFQITANAIESTYEADTAQDAITAYLADAGYDSVEEAAEVCGQSVEDFLGEITVEEIAE